MSKRHRRTFNPFVTGGANMNSSRTHLMAGRCKCAFYKSAVVGLTLRRKRTVLKCKSLRIHPVPSERLVENRPVLKRLRAIKIPDDVVLKRLRLIVRPLLW
ncbi:hypothetical protein TNCV_854071 [Trichonephila clavipes]|nr:hypothetical protein TNCV_854071 [Trichonephila clavipes]